MKPTRHLGPYVLAWICGQRCGWYQHPFAPFQRPVCPRCGSRERSQVVGRFIWETTGFWIWRDKQIVGFEEKKP
jgi:hypothetical protein